MPSHPGVTNPVPFKACRTAGMRHLDVIDVDDATLVDRASRDCAGLLGISADPERVRVYRWPDATRSSKWGPRC